MTQNSLEFGWVIGFLEGEGCFINPLRRGGGIRVDAKQVQREPLERMLRYTAIGRIRGPHSRDANPKHSPIYTWSVGGLDAREFVQMIRPHMSPRRQGQIDKVLAQYRLLGKEFRSAADRSMDGKKSVASRRANASRNQLRLVGVPA